MIKGIILRYARAWFFSKVCPKGRLDNQSLTLVVLSKPNYRGERKYPTPTCSSYPVPSKWGERLWEILVTFSQEE